MGVHVFAVGINLYLCMHYYCSTMKRPSILPLRLIRRVQLRLILILSLIGGTGTVLAQTGSLLINEIQVCNTDQFIDPSYNYGAWIEVYNRSEKDIALAGLYISDDLNEPQKWQMPTTMPKVPAHGFQVIWFDHNKADGTYGGQSYNQVRFKPSVERGTIFLSDVEGTIVCRTDYPAGIPRCAYARTTDGSDEWGYTALPTPGQSNATSTFASERMSAPVVSVESGVYEKGKSFSFNVRIPAGATLIYTTDGTTPSLDNGVKKDSPNNYFAVSGTKVYRFMTYQEGYLPSPVVTRSFIYKNHDYYLPILSIVTHPDHLYDNNIGIYCSGKNGVSGKGQSSAKNWNMDWERPVNVEYLVPETNEEGETSFISYINQELDMEICGGWSRGYGGGTTDGVYWDAKSSFRLKCDKEYEGINVLDYPVFPHKPYNKYKVWQVRNGGNDTYARILDASLGQVVIRSDFNIDAQDCQPAHVFFNGQYLGMLNIRESNNRHYGYSNWGIDTDDMDQFELSGGYKVMLGTDEAWKQMVSYAKQLSKDLSEETYQKVCSMLDIDEFVNYMAYCSYMGPSDWMTNVNNMKGYRSRSDGGKFRMVLFDMDSAFDTSSMFSNLMNNSYGSDIDDLFRYLMAYPPFRQKFINAYCLVDGSLFEPQRCREIVQEMYDERNPALIFEGNRSSMQIADKIQSAHHGSRMTKLQSTLGLPEPYRVTLGSNLPEARLTLGEQIIPTGRFDGFLYNDGGNLRITAQAPAGYAFAGWDIEGIEGAPSRSETIVAYGDSWQYYDKGSMDSKDWKAESFNASSAGWKEGRAPFGYASSGRPMASMIATRLDYGSDSNDKRPTYYFRTQFYLDQTPTDNEEFRLHYKVDDGFRFYINGKDIDGYRCPAGLDYNYTTGEWAGDQPDTGTYTIDPADLQLGWNTLAVEVHNTSATSSDIFWDASLVRLFYEESDMEHGTITSETFDLAELTDGGTLRIEALYEPITDARELQNQGVTPVRINEVSAGNDIYINDWGKKNDWVELYNTTDEEIDVAGMYLSDKKNKPQKWQIAGTGETSTIIPPHGTLIVWCDQLEPVSQLHAPFKLDNADGAVVSIQAGDGSWADKMEYVEQPRWQTFGRYPDGANFTSLMSWPTINRSNLMSSMDYASLLPSSWDDGQINVTIDLAQGWNWTSHNLASDVHTSRFTASTVHFLGQKDSYWLDSATGTWAGSLNVLEAGRGYKLKAKAPAEVHLRGKNFDPQTMSVALAEGWNWIGFPLLNATSLTSALELFTPMEGDMIVGLDEMATYEDGEWDGTLTSLRPGQAYLYKSGRQTVVQWNALTTSSPAPRHYRAPKVSNDMPWNYDMHAYPHVESLIATLQTDETNIAEPLCVGAFAGEECRGVGRWDGERVVFNIHGELADSLVFRLLDTEGNTFVATTRTVFQPQTVLGSRMEPFVLNFNLQDIEDLIASPSVGSQVVERSFYNLQGQQIASPQGICIEKCRMSDGSTRVRKIRE